MSNNKEKSYAVVLGYRLENSPEPDTMLVTTWAVDRSHALGIAIGTKLKPEDDILHHQVFELDLSNVSQDHAAEVSIMEKRLKDCRSSKDKLKDKLKEANERSDKFALEAAEYRSIVAILRDDIKALTETGETEDTEVYTRHKEEIEKYQKTIDELGLRCSTAEEAYTVLLAAPTLTEEAQQGSCGYDEMLALIEENKRTPYLMAAHLEDFIKELKEKTPVCETATNQPVKQDCAVPRTDIKPSTARWEKEAEQAHSSDYKVKGTPDAVFKIAELETQLKEYTKKYTVARNGLGKTLKNYGIIEDTLNGDDPSDIIQYLQGRLPNFIADVNMHFKSSEIDES